MSLLLTLAMLTGGVAPISAAGNSSSSEKLKTEKVDADIASRLAFEDVSPAESEVQYADGDIVRVSVVLEKKSTLEKFATADALSSNSAVAYREQLDNEQESIIQAIEDKTDAPLDVVWNLTLAANIISANVKYKEIETIKEIDGVKSVFV